MRTDIPIQELSDFLHCQLFWRFKHELALPFRDDIGSELLRKSASTMVGKWFSEVATGIPAAKAREKAIRSMLAHWGTTEEGKFYYVAAHAHAVSILSTISSQINLNADLVIGGNIGVSIPAGEFKIIDKVGGIYIKNELVEKDNKTIYGVSVGLDTDPPLADRTKNLVGAILRYTIVKAMWGKNYPIKYTKILLPSNRRINNIPLPLDRREALFLVRSVADTMNVGVLIPTDDIKKCQGCWYRDICSSYFTRQAQDARVMHKVNRVLKEKVKLHDDTSIIRKLQCSDEK